ncbi:MAG: hypothetical protein K2I81_01660 [Alphaproteobacteria bacterium]|nr:hypothetical protein [Alphaproteobacteria bacterium]
MESNKQSLSYVEFRPKHRALTNLMRRNWSRRPQWWQAILAKCTIEPYLGALPPELRARVSKENLSAITRQFRIMLEEFLAKNSHDIKASTDGPMYELPEIGRLFGVSCVVEFGPINYAGFRIWSGLFGLVGKMSFPEINAKYALKLFYDDNGNYYDNGVCCEIPTAFAAAHAEPRNNSRVYMAAVMNEPYLLSRWEGDCVDGRVRKNENEIFVTAPKEEQNRNYRGGRRIDYGETYRTAYGSASYRVRKMCRQLISAARAKDYARLRQIAQVAPVAATAARNDLDDAVVLATYMADCNVAQMIAKAVRNQR